MASFYEFFENMLGFFNNDYAIVFQTLYENGGYNDMGLILIIIPVLFLLLFYLIWKYPYATIVHWFLYISLIALIVGGSTYGAVRLDVADYLVDTDPEVVDFTNSLVLKYTLLNIILALVISFLYSLILKLISKVQMHLPF